VVRLLRVFRLIQENPFLRKETDSFFVSFGSLGPILVPVCAVTYFFGVVGLHLLKGVTEYRCRETPEPIDGHWVADPTIRNLCGQWQCPEHLTCGAPTEYGLHFDKHELASLEFFYGFNNFDTVYESFLSAFLFFTGTGWCDTMFIYWKVMDRVVCALYFVIMIFFLEVSLNHNY
jgi:hypothetical protein